MLLWRGDKETEAKDVPALKMRDGGHAYFFQVFTGAAIAGELDGALRVYMHASGVMGSWSVIDA